LLLHPGGAEAAGEGAAERDAVVEVVAPRQLTRERAPEVGVVLETGGGSGQELLRQQRFEVDVQRRVAAVLVEGLPPRVAREPLGPDGGDGSVLVEDGDRRVVRAAVLVRDRIAGLDRVTLPPPFGARRHVEGTR